MKAEKLYSGSRDANSEGTSPHISHVDSLTLTPTAEHLEKLNPMQIAASEIAGFRFLLSRSKKDAKRELPKLRVKAGNEEKSDKELISDHASRLLATMVSLQHEPENLVQDAYYEKANEILTAYEDGKEKLFDKASTWKLKDFKRMVRGAVQESQDLEDKVVYERHTPITQADVYSAKKTLVRERIATAATTLASEGFSHGAGLLATAFSLEEQLPENSTLALGGLATVTYGALAYILIRNGFVNATLLEKTGVSTDPISKNAFEKAIDNERRAALLGYAKWHGAWEVPFYGVATYVGIKYGVEAGLVNFITANVAGTGKNIVINGFTRLGIGISEVVKKRKDNTNNSSLNGGVKLA